MRPRLYWLLVLAGLLREAVAGPLVVDRMRLSAGGGRSAGGTLALVSTVGQPEAGPRLAGGSLTLETGFLVQAFAGAGNQPPTVTFATTNLTVLHDSGAQSLPGFAGFSPGPAAEALQTLLGYTVSNSNSNLFSAQPALDSAGTLTFTPAAGAVGASTVTVIVQDNGGTAGDGADRSTNTFLLTVASAEVTFATTAAGAPGSTVAVPIYLLAAGNESALSFSVNFDPTTLSFLTATVGSGLSLVANTSQAAAGRVGFLVGRSVGTSFTAGSNALGTLNFQIAPLAAVGNTSLAFGDAPVPREVSDATAHPVSHIRYLAGGVAITNHATAYEGDVSPRASGNGLLTVSDAAQIGRFVAGLDPVLTTGQGSELQRVDCAPRGTLGDGVLSVSDFVQALRYAAGLDPLTLAGGPTGLAAAAVPKLATTPTGSTTRTMRLVSGPLVAGEAAVISVVLTGTGIESGGALSLGFDPAVLRYLGAELGTGAPDGTLLVNDRRVANGKLGLVLALPAGRTVAPGAQELIRISFAVATAPPAATPLVVNADGPVVREVTDVNATPLATQFLSAQVPISLPPFLKLLGQQRGVGGALQFAFGARDQSAVTATQAARLEAWFTRDLGRGTWEPLTGALTLENGRVLLRDPDAASAGFRFYKVIESP
ncbi:MAG: hypothetical protein RL514_3760 [Verrucomicrobiota bacterium]|jgi:hypothetical protein